MEILKELGFLTIGSVSIVSLVGYFSKSIFESYLKTKVDSYKSNLEKELEVFKNELRRKDFEYQTKFSTLHIERAKITKDLYRKLKCFYNNLIGIHIYANMIPPPELNNPMEIESLSILNSSFIALSEFFDENRIMFSTKISTSLNELTSKYWEQNFVYQKLRTYEHMREIDKSEELSKVVEEHYEELYKIHKEKIPSILNNLESEFKKILGVEN